MLPVLLIAHVAVAAPEGLATARALIDELEFTRAIAEIESRLAVDLPLEARIEGCELLALAWSAKSNAEEAKRAYVRLLRLDPGRPVDAAHSPKMRSAFQAARRELEEHPPALAEVRIAQEQSSIRVRGRVLDPLAIVAQVRINDVTTDVSDQSFEAVIPTHDDVRELVISARAASGFEVSRSVHAVVIAPRAAPVLEEEPLMPWWGWTILGVVAASGIAAGVYFAARPDAVVGEIDVPPP